MKDTRTREEKWVELDGKSYLVKKTPIIASVMTVYSCYEHTAEYFITHHTSTSYDDDSKSGRLGMVGSRNISAEIDSLPIGDERSKAVLAWYNEQYEEAYRAILKAFPDATGRRSMGQIDSWDDELAARIAADMNAKLASWKAEATS